MTLFLPATSADHRSATVFAGKVALLDPAGVIRMVERDGDVQLWARAGFGVLGGVTIAGRVDPSLLTVYATDLVAALAVARTERADPGRDHPGEWHTQLPPRRGWVEIGTLDAERIAAEVRTAAAEAHAAVEIERAGEWTARTKATVPPRLLDSARITVATDAASIPISMRMLLALSGMGFVEETAAPVCVSVTRTWLRLTTESGTVARRRMADLPLVGARR